jgi:lysophospholipase L1-like esterase
MNPPIEKTDEKLSMSTPSETLQPKTRTRFRKAMGNLGVAVVTTGICLGIGEIAVRMLMPRLSQPAGDAVLGNAPARGHTAVWTDFPEYGGNLVKHTNRAGFFNISETSIEKSSGVRRIAFVGDSQTEGLCADAESYPHQMEAIANQSAPASVRYEVLNAGFGGYSPYQYFLRFRRDVLPYHPDHLIVGIYVGNDLWDLTRRDDRPYLIMDRAGNVTEHPPMFVDEPKEARKLWERSRLYGLALATVGKSLKYQATRAEKLFTNARETGHGYGETMKYMIDVGRLSHDSVNMMTQSIGQQLWFRAFPETLPPALQLNRYVMERFQKICRDENIRLTYVFIPTKVRIEPADIDVFKTFGKHGFTPESAAAFENQVTDKMLNDCRALGIEAIDLRKPLEDNARGLRLYYPRDMHLNVTGNRLVGGAIAEALHDKF